MQVDNEDLIFTLETVVERFGEEMAPYAVGLTQHLAAAFWRMQVSLIISTEYLYSNACPHGSHAQCLTCEAIISQHAAKIVAIDHFLLALSWSQVESGTWLPSQNLPDCVYEPI